MIILIWLLERIHDLIHWLHLPRHSCFPIWRLGIKLDNWDSFCWKCKYFESFYYDGMTYDCAKLGKNQLWGWEKDCKKFKAKK